MIVGGPLLSCCCAEDCSQLVLSDIPGELPMSAGWRSIVYNRSVVGPPTGFGVPWTAGDPCEQACSNYDPIFCCDVVTELEITFQGVLLRSNVAPSPGVPTTLYNWSKVEFEWQITQTLVEGQCNNRIAHQESGGGTYDDPPAWLPSARLRCVPQANQYRPICASMIPVESDEGTSFVDPNEVALTGPALVLQVSTSSIIAGFAAFGLAANAPTRPSFPWPGIGANWPQCRGASFPLAYLRTGGSASGLHSFFRPEAFTFARGGLSLQGAYTPVAGTVSNLGEYAPTGFSEHPQHDRHSPDPYNACSLSSSVLQPPCSPGIPYWLTGLLAPSSIFATVG